MVRAGGRVVKRKKRKVLSAAEKAANKLKRDHIKFARSMFAQAGFHRVTSASGKEFRYEGVTSDFDDIFILENTVIVCEYTTANESNVSSHLKSKKILYDKIQANNEHFLDFLTSNFDEIKNNIKQIYSFDRIHVRIVYASRFSVRSESPSRNS